MRSHPNPGPREALPTYASFGSTAAGPSWAWQARGRCAAHRPGLQGALPGCAVWLVLFRAGGHCSECGPHGGGLRAEGAGPLVAAVGRPGRPCSRPCQGPGAAGEARLSEEAVPVLALPPYYSHPVLQPFHGLPLTSSLAPCTTEGLRLRQIEQPSTPQL